MNYFGDIPVEHLELMKELKDLESWFDMYGQTIEPSIAAKGFVSIAHDYIFMYMEEEGLRLINRAEKICPGYFVEKIHEHAKYHSDYKKLVSNLEGTIGLDYMKKWGFKSIE